MTDYSQRWVERNGVWVPRRHIVDTKLLEAELIEDDTTARAFVEAHHYSASYPLARVRVGLYRCGELVGVAIFSTPGGPSAIQSWTGYEMGEGVELGRFVLTDEVGFNAETWFWARAKKLLQREKRELRVLLSYSDPMRRESLDGDVVLPGHVGTIYQAANARYLGRSSSRTLHLDRGGRIVSPFALTKIRQQKRGHEYARALLEEASGTTQADDESPKVWVKRALGELRQVKHPGNHTYVWGLARGVKLPRGKSYPKQVDPVQLGLLAAA